jgi:hypothetical protein
MRLLSALKRHATWAFAPLLLPLSIVPIVLMAPASFLRLSWIAPAAVHVALKLDTILVDLPKALEREDLKPARIG